MIVCERCPEKRKADVQVTIEGPQMLEPGVKHYCAPCLNELTPIWQLFEQGGTVQEETRVPPPGSTDAPVRVITVAEPAMKLRSITEEGRTS